MLTGARPWEGDSAAAVALARLSGPVPDPMAVRAVHPARPRGDHAQGAGPRSGRSVRLRGRDGRCARRRRSPAPPWPRARPASRRPARRGRCRRPVPAGRRHRPGRRRRPSLRRRMSGAARPTRPPCPTRRRLCRRRRCGDRRRRRHRRPPTSRPHDARDETSPVVWIAGLVAVILLGADRLPRLPAGPAVARSAVRRRPSAVAVPNFVGTARHRRPARGRRPRPRPRSRPRAVRPAGRHDPGPGSAGRDRRRRPAPVNVTVAAGVDTSRSRTSAT